MRKTAMIVDDSRVARMTLKKLLLAADFEVIEQNSAEAALDYLQSTNAYPQIIFMDVMMNGMDGLTATREIKADANLSHIPVVMCTGNDSSGDQDEALEAGAVAALTKPPAASALTAILDNIQTVTQVAVMPDDNNTVMSDQTLFDQDKFETQILNQCKQQLLPEMQKYLENMAEEICRTQVEKHLASGLKEIEYHLIQQLKEKVEVTADEAAKQACTIAAEDAVSDYAYNAVKQVVEEADIAHQISEFLEHKGEEWLTQQEADLGQQLSEQLAHLIPQQVKASLDMAMPDLISQQIQQLMPATDTDETYTNYLEEEQIQQMISQALNEYDLNHSTADTDDAIQQQLAQMQEKLAMLKGMTIILGLIVTACLFIVLV